MKLNIKKEYILKAIEDKGFKTFTKVQEEVIPKALKKKDIVGQSQTGSGKTHAFLIPLFESLDEESKKVQIVITTPTRELAMQIYNVSNHIASFSEKPIDIRMYVGGSDRNKELKRLDSSQPQIVIGTPGKIKDLSATESKLLIHTAHSFVVDEADMTLDNGFIKEIDHFASIFKKDVHMMVFSATIPNELKPFLNKYMKKPEYIHINPKELTNINIEHILMPVKNKDKLLILDNLLEVINPYCCLIFANTKTKVDEIRSFLVSKGKKVGVIHGGLDPRERRRMIKRISNLEFRYIIASDIAARGIDIEGVSHIINFELPSDVEFYVHRSGRTGRAYMDGICISLFERLDDNYLLKLEAKNIEFKYNKLENNELILTKERNSRKNRARTESEIDRQARKAVKKPKKVRPGYKKRMNAELQQIKKKMLHEKAREDNRKKRR